jgi:hypothetical protein
MHTSRITNASLFVTVLSACLGLSMTGASAQAHAEQDTSAAVSKSQALVFQAFSQHLSPQKVRKLAATSNSYFQVAVCQPQGQREENFYKNTRALIDKNRLLGVTHLPRAWLVSLLTEQPLAS